MQQRTMSSTIAPAVPSAMPATVPAWGEEEWGVEEEVEVDVGTERKAEVVLLDGWVFDGWVLLASLGLPVTLLPSDECDDVMLEIALISLMMLLTSGESPPLGLRVLVTVPPVVTDGSVMVTVVVYEPIVSVAVLGLQDASNG
jgi:hypothetical protein